ncbi:hypothetical protein [Pedobacter sp. KBS0701]|uniref:hypothetical protein n=1 Tax=unclassified Pedobacter TaxID=2628915 RepID=UPI00110DD548|nr:hypothetical protein [Pedobacter sp. KBS0701]QDW25674.1 hypothetical protein FFJ24_012935 [Pedobacter sp. KBS0701]
MSKFINWKSNWLNGNFQLFADGVQKGMISFSSWRSDAESMFEDKNYHFANEGFWQSRTKVIDRKTNEVVAIINYDSWKSKAVISLNTGEQYEWKSTGVWKSQFTVSNYKDAHIMYSSNSNTGTISSDTHNELLIITGLFIKHIYNKRVVVLIACLMPIITISINRH